MALIGLSIVFWAIKKIAKTDRQYEWMRFIVLLTMCMVAGILSNKYGLTIRRFSNIFFSNAADICWQNNVSEDKIVF